MPAIVATQTLRWRTPLRTWPRWLALRWLAFVAYEYKTVTTVTFVIFALNFLTFRWELAADGAVQFGFAQSLERGWISEQFR